MFKGFLNKILGEEKVNDIYGVLFEGDHTLGERFEMAKNGVQSKFGINEGKKSSRTMKSIQPKKNISINKQITEPVDTTVLNTRTAYEDRFGDTIRVDNNFYMLPESINLSNKTLGYRNRKSRNTFKTSGGLIPTYKPIVPYEKGKWLAKDSSGNINHFFGYDKNGKAKVGPLEIFGPGDTMTQVYYSQLNGIPKTKSGEYIYGPGTKNANNRRSPYADIRRENGKTSRDRLLIMTGHKRGGFNANTMDFAGGGAYLVKVDNELRLIRGSVNNVLDEFQKIQQNHKNKPITLYEVDNGSYNRGLRPWNGIYDSNKLSSYDSQNTDTAGGGHFFYIK